MYQTQKNNNEAKDSLLYIVTTSIPFASFLAVVMDGILRSSTAIF